MDNVTHPTILTTWELFPSDTLFIISISARNASASSRELISKRGDINCKDLGPRTKFHDHTMHIEYKIRIYYAQQTTHA